VGIVIIICWDEIPDESDLKGLITGKPTKLESQFRLTYTMILNLLRVEDLKVLICPLPSVFQQELSYIYIYIYILLKFTVLNYFNLICRYALLSTAGTSGLIYTRCIIVISILCFGLSS
jgi:hypothetical protein